MHGTGPLLAAYYTHKSGGLCTRLYRLLNGAARRGIEVYYFTLDNPPEAALDSRVRVALIPFPFPARTGTLFWLAFTPWASLFIAMQSVKLRPRVLIAFGAYYSFLLRITRMLTSARTVLFVRSLVFKNNRINAKPALLRLISDLLERLGIRSADRIVCMTEAMRSELAAFAGTPGLAAEILPNDVPVLNQSSGTALPEKLRNLLSAPSAPFLVLTSGVLDRRKNIALLLDTWRRIPQQSPLHLAIAGEGPLRKELEAEAARLGLRSVTFLGWIPDMTPVIAASALILHPSLHEGISNSILEGWGAGRPVLASDTPELRELMAYDELLFDPAGPDALAARLVTISSEPSTYERLVELTAERRARFTFDWEAGALNAIGI